MIYGAQRYAKRYVEVVALHRLDGQQVPLTIRWDDGRRFDVDMLEEPTYAQCEHTNGHAVRYKVLIKNRRRTLYRDDQGWFVEYLEGARPQRFDPRLGDPPC